MNALAYVALEGLDQTIDRQAALEVYRILAETCLRLTGGQHLDISSEDAQVLPLEVYWSMVGGKTAALVSASVRLGAVIAGANPEMIRILETFGYSLGLAFQVQDDWLGIWGDPAKTGKSSLTDLIARKKTLPVIFGLQQRGRFYQAWNSQTENRIDIEQLAALLEEEGAKAFTAAESARLMEEALRALNAVGLENEGGKALRELATGLQTRNF
jgi:geranylgeranyl diphosphate synthase type I